MSDISKPGSPTADQAHLREAIRLSEVARKRSNMPFGALLEDEAKAPFEAMKARGSL